MFEICACRIFLLFFLRIIKEKFCLVFRTCISKSIGDFCGFWWLWSKEKYKFFFSFFFFFKVVACITLLGYKAKCDCFRHINNFFDLFCLMWVNLCIKTNILCEFAEIWL